MSIPIGLQLYSVREQIAQDFEGTIRRIARAGYVGVEAAGVMFDHVKPVVAARLFADLDLEVPAAHSALPLGDEQNQVLDTMAALNCSRLVCPWLPAEEFRTREQIQRNCERLNQADEVARKNGLTLFYHNHWWEYEERVDDRPVYQVMLDYLAPTIQLELDTYWAKTGGANPAAVIREFGARVPLLHIKDGPARTDEPMVAVGDGVMDWTDVFAASEPYAEWAIVELDRCATDMLVAVERSYTYLIAQGYAHGR